MAKNPKSTTLYSSNGKAYYLQAYSNEESTNTPQNSSRIYVEAKLTSTGYRWTSNYNSYLRIYWHDNRENYDRLVAETALTSIANNGSAYASGYIDPLYHNSDGELSGYAYATFTKGGTSSYTPNTGGVTTDWTELTAIPRQADITDYNDFNDEQNPTITYNNPGGFRINARLEFAGTNIERDNIPNTGSYTFNLTDTERKLLRQKCTGNSMIVRGVIATCIGGTTENYWSLWDKTMTIVNGNPTFDNFNFADVNSKTLALTGNSTSMVKGYSNVKVTIPTSMKATAKKEASLSKYRVSIGTANPVDITYSSDSDVTGTVNNADSSTINVYAIDSRNNSKLVSKQATNFIPYSNIEKGNIDVLRTNGVSEDVTLKINGTFNKVNFGKITNSIKSAQYRYRIKGTDTWSPYNNLTLTIKENNFSYDGLIKGDTETLGFDINNSYELEVLVKDELSETTFTDTFGSGTPNIALAKNGVGIMGKYDESVGGKAQVAGNPIAYFPIGAIYLSIDSTNPSTLFGGTWQQIAKGRTLVGVNIDDTDFNVSEKAGGSKTHYHTPGDSLTACIGAPHGNPSGIGYVAMGASGGDSTYSVGNASSYTANGHPRRSHNTRITGQTQSANSMSPYLTCYMWKRTA